MPAYGLPAGTVIYYGATGFPDWVYDLTDYFGLQASTYGGHQEGQRAEAGFAPNPQGLNRGIDWEGPTASMQRFADYLLTVRSALEQVIWENPYTGQRVGVAGGDDVTESAYYAQDYSGHTDHVHTRQSQPIPLPGSFVATVKRRPPFTEIEAWSTNASPRSGTAIDLFLLHTQEGGDGDPKALAQWMNGNGVSYHYTVSTGKAQVLVCDVVDTDLASWSVLSANPRSINLCFAGSKASWSRQEWLANSNSLEVAAYLAVQDCRKYGIPLNVIAPPYVRAAGITDHNYVTTVLGDGTHTDVGSDFPWDVFTQFVVKYADETPSAPTIPATPGGFLMALTDAEQRELLDLARQQSGVLRVSRSPLRHLGEGPTQTVTGFEWSTDGSVHLLVVEALASLGHPPTLQLLQEIATADPAKHPDRQEDRLIAQAIINKLTMTMSQPVGTINPADVIRYEVTEPVEPQQVPGRHEATAAADGDLYSEMDQLKGQIHTITESLAALSDHFLGGEGLDMLPGDAASDDTDGRSVHAKDFRRFSVGQSDAANPSDIVFGEFGCARPTSPRLPVATLPVVDVVGIGSNAKMVGLHADSSITRMQHAHPVRNRSNVDAVCRNVGWDVDSTQPESTVAVRVGVSGPVPTTFTRRLAGHVGGERFSFSDASPTHDGTGGRVTVSTVPFVVRVAQPLGFSRMCATKYRALHLSKFTQAGS